MYIRLRKLSGGKLKQCTKTLPATIRDPRKILEEAAKDLRVQIKNRKSVLQYRKILPNSVAFSSHANYTD
jgi:hypothetical protein